VGIPVIDLDETFVEIEVGPDGAPRRTDDYEYRRSDDGTYERITHTPLDYELRLGGDLDAWRPGRRLRLHRPTHDRERHRATDKRGDACGKQQHASPSPLGSPCFLDRLGKARNDLLRRRQFPSDRLLGAAEFLGNATLPVVPTQAAARRLRAMKAQTDCAAGDVEGPDRGVGQAAGETLPRSQPGSGGHG
jgi:hypothetical protein